MRWLAELAAPGARRALAWQALIDASGSAVAIGVTTLYLVRQVGLTPRDLGLLTAGAGLAGLAATLPASQIAARLGARRFLIASALVRGCLYVALALASHPVAVVALIVSIGAAEAGAYSLFQILFDDLGLGDRRGELLGARRAIANVGFLIGAPAVGLVASTGTGTAYALAFVFDAGSFFASAALVSRLPAAPDRRRAERRTMPRLVLDPRYLGLSVLAALFSLTMTIFEIALPLSLSLRSHFPGWLFGASLAANALLVLLFQQRLAANAGTLSSARRAVAMSAVCLAGGCLALALNDTNTKAPAAVVLCGVALLTAGEMLESAGFWTISHAMASPARRAEYLAAFDMGFPLLRVAGPPLAAWIGVMGAAGWIVGATIFVAGGVASHLLTARAGSAEAPNLADSKIHHPRADTLVDRSQAASLQEELRRARGCVATHRRAGAAECNGDDR